MNTFLLPLVNWGMGAAIIGVFVFVCILLISIVFNLAKGDKIKKPPKERN